MQDQAFLGPESGLAVPDGDGGVDLHIATQWLHVDRDQVAASLGLRAREGAARARRRRRRLRRARGRVDADPRVHARAAHRAAGEDGLRPRGVVPRPRPPPSVPDGVRARRPRRRPARVRARADRARRRRLRVELHRGVLQRGVLRGRALRGAERLAHRARRLHQQPAVRRDARVRRRAGRVRATRRRWTGSPAALGMDPVELRIRNAIAPGDRLPTGQVVPEPAPVAELLERVQAFPLPPDAGDAPDQRELPGGVANTTHGEGVRRGVGFAVALKNVGYSEGFDDYSTARVRADRRRGGPARGGPHRGGRGRARASRPCRRRSPAPSWGSSACTCCRPTPPSARPARPPPRARPTSPAAR